MRRDVFNEEHELFRQQVRKFVDKEIVPKVEEWNARGTSDRASWNRAGSEGFLGVSAPAEYGGAGAGFLFAADRKEEIARAPADNRMLSPHSHRVMPYPLQPRSQEAKR